MAGEPRPDRRAFLGRAGRITAAVACGAAAGLGAGCASFPRVTLRLDGGRARIPLSAVGDASGVLVDHPERPLPVYLHRFGDGRWAAVLTRCTHRGCQVDPTPDRLVCPCHGSEFAPDGAVLEGPARDPLVRYPVAVEPDQIVVDLTSTPDHP